MLLGKRGSGKSTKLSQILSEYKRFVLYDTLVEGAYAEYTHVHTYRELCDILIQNKPIFQIAYRSLEEDVTQEEDFERCCKAVMACRNLTFAVEEVDLFCKSWKMPLPFEHMISIGRHREISVIAVSRRPASIHPLIRSQASTVITFRQTEPRDIDWLEQVIGDAATKVPKLRQYESLIWEDNPATNGTDNPPEEEPEKEAESIPEDNCTHNNNNSTPD